MRPAYTKVKNKSSELALIPVWLLSGKMNWDGAIEDYGIMLSALDGGVVTFE